MVRFYLIAALTFCISHVTIATCNCPASTDCAPCKGGIVRLVLRYTGSTPAQVVIKDNKAVYFSKVVVPNENITIIGTKNNGKFETDVLDILIGGILHTNIDVNCGQDVYAKSKFGNFTVVSGESRQGGTLCCAPNAVDDVAPVITNCLGNIEIKIISDLCVQSVTWTPPIATDDCQLSTFISSHDPGHEFKLGTTKVTYTAKDATGNTSSCSFNVTLTDGRQPVFTECPSDIFIKASDSTDVKVEWEIPKVKDNCEKVSLKSKYKPGALFKTGTTSVEYTANDSAGNVTSCRFNIVITEPEISLIIDNFITPDGDGINDIWKIGNIEKYDKNKIKIFDRWGSVIFSTDRYDNNLISWNGTNTSGAFVPAGTYFYIIELGNKSSIIKKGFIELIK